MILSHLLFSSLGQITTDLLLRVLFLDDYNTRVVVLGVMVLGLAGGVVGGYMLLRKHALLGDALSHSTLPGIAAAFMVMASFGGSGKSLPGLLLGATITGSAGVGCVMLIRRYTRLKEDAALGIVLSVFFGFGIVLMGFVQRMKAGSAAGIETFIYGKTAAMLASDAQLIALVALICVGLCALLYKELKILSFDPAYTATQGWPVLLLDGLMMAMVIGVTVVGLQAVGLILVIAMLIIPAASARFWTHRLGRMLVLSAVIGALSGWMGASISALLPRMPAGAIIVMVAAGAFVISLFFGQQRGVVARWVRYVQLQRQVGLQNLLRTCFELVETRQLQHDEDGHPRIPFNMLLEAKSWSPRYLRRLLKRADHDELLNTLPQAVIELTDTGMVEARRQAREHRLWELYLITHADIAASHVDRGADMIEHVLGTEMVLQLEKLLEQQSHPVVPATPHRI
ncbi:MAG: metal ABC transporter permease [Phycisphaerales bacterium]|nr:metal ABC transporter permease [Phycisphaerales bacterium]